MLDMRAPTRLRRRPAHRRDRTSGSCGRPSFVWNPGLFGRASMLELMAVMAAGKSNEAYLSAQIRAARSELARGTDYIAVVSSLFRLFGGMGRADLEAALGRMARRGSSPAGRPHDGPVVLVSELTLLPNVTRVGALSVAGSVCSTPHLDGDVLTGEATFLHGRRERLMAVSRYCRAHGITPSECTFYGMEAADVSVLRAGVGSPAIR